MGHELFVPTRPRPDDSGTVHGQVRADGQALIGIPGTGAGDTCPASCTCGDTCYIYECPPTTPAARHPAADAAADAGQMRETPLRQRAGRGFWCSRAAHAHTQQTGSPVKRQSE